MNWNSPLQFNTHLLRTVKKSQSPSFRHWVWRTWFVSRSQNPEAGFILPTVVFMLLIMSLVISVLTFRTFSRTVEVSGQRQQRSLYNAATPAIDRSKAKLEYLFEKTNLTSVPTDTEINSKLTSSDFDLPDESRIDINNDATTDNAWTYTLDTDGDGTAETRVIYSILHQSQDTASTVTLESDDSTKASNLIVRNGPIDLYSGSRPNCSTPSRSVYQGWEPTINSSSLRKAFQVHAVVFNTNTGAAATLEMQQDRQANFGNKWGAWFLYDLEINTNGTFYWNGAMHTEGSFLFNDDRGDGNGDVRLYLATNSNSCVYTKDASVLSMTEVINNDGVGGYQGQLLIGRTKDNGTTGDVQIDRYVDSGSPTSDTIDRSDDSVLENGASGYLPSEVGLDPVQLAVAGTQQNLSPQTTDYDFYRNSTIWSTSASTGDARTLLSTGRVLNEQEPTPFVDDTYRADNRWGPKPTYGEGKEIELADQGAKNGDDISGGYTTDLTKDAPITSTDEEDYGLDGYWERRARAQGLRIIVGQRLELGNPFGWGGTNDPLYPLNTTDDTIIDNGSTQSTMRNRKGELLQWRTLRDNLAAVQSAAVYHYNNAPDFPIACLAATVHPGTATQETRSRTFQTLTVNETTAKVDANGDGDQADTSVEVVLTDFLGFYDEDTNGNGTLDTGEDTNGNGRLDVRGQGTNGLEFSPPFAGNSTTFAAQINSSTSPLRIALTNLAYFAGDPAGAFPAKQDAQSAKNTNAAVVYGNYASGSSAATGVTHPHPYLSMWGDFSNLRRVITKLQGGATYAGLSTADKSTLHTAACTLGMLAYSVGGAQSSLKVQSTSYTISTTLSGNINSFAVEADKMLDGNTSNGDLSEFVEDLNGTAYDVDWNRNGVIDSGVQTAPLPTGYVDYDTSAGSFYNDLLNPDSSYYSSRGITFTAAEKDNFAIKRFGAAMAAQPGGGFYKDDPAAVLADLAQAAKLVTLVSVSQLDRDRTYGFVNGVSGSVFAPSGYEAKSGAGWWSPSTGTVPYGYGGSGSTINVTTGCDPYLFMGSTSPLASVKTTSGSTVDLTTGVTNSGADKGIALALSICSSIATTTSSPKYPALYYLFPTAAHAHDGYITSSVQTAGGTQVLQNTTNPSTADEYVRKSTQTGSNPYIYDRDNSRGVNWNKTYSVVEDAGSLGDGDGYADTGETIAEFMNYLGVLPRTTTSAWKTPITTTSTDRVNTITFNGTSWYTAFLDTAFFDGREHMNIRALNLDLDLMRKTPFQTDTTGYSHWLPLPDLTSTGTIIYAFREDAMREDGIARPYSSTFADADAAWTTCKDFTNLTNYTDSDNVNCRMNFTASTPQDPPVSSANGISPKPVDMYPDPARRPYGFRLRNGSDLRRLNSSTAITDDQRGFAFITDNSAYIQGDFNKHTDGTNTLEEFTNALASNWSNFYTGTPTRSVINTNFADDTNDYWRPAEILADAVTFLSSSFAPGSIDQGITDTGTQSYRSLNEPFYNSAASDGESYTNNTNGTDSDRDTGEDITSTTWIREDGTTTSTTLPIKISRRGFPLNNGALDTTNHEWGVTSTTSREKFKDFGEGHGNKENNVGGGTFPQSAFSQINTVSGTTYINAMIVQGIVPARANQSYGTLVNFPRFMEKWTGATLNFSGSMFQLSFSSSATGPFDHDAWEPGTAPVSGGVTGNGERILYYGAPTRQWGFDIGLLYAPPGVAARRLTSGSSTRSEFYREVAVDDPYIEDLLCAEDSTGTNIMDTTKLPFTCP